MQITAAQIEQKPGNTFICIVTYFLVLFLGWLLIIFAVDSLFSMFKISLEHISFCGAALLLAIVHLICDMLYVYNKKVRK